MEILYNCTINQEQRQNRGLEVKNEISKTIRKHNYKNNLNFFSQRQSSVPEKNHSPGEVASVNTNSPQYIVK